ncbi:ATP-grasp domain-containing protein [Kitasatospora sp. RG8]|uniref:ATP-grasp domain-containing protein n=1 Tax=Kitasatospora sp. RG8 TaxID=2820815 RepID=UPI001ADF8AF5|nr:ATP-grasp domain-containing protein [Kitasatospora sp. RG8]MBP0452924.1 ATP-grasp domain-containing protein [Kitasatospora sp. RG8]
MTSVVVAIVPGAAVRPAEIAAAAQACGHTPVFVALPGALGGPEHAECAALGPVLACDPDAVGATVEELRRHRPAGVTTFSEAMVPLVSAIGDGLGLPFHDPATVTLLTDKWAQRRRLAEAGVDAVRCTVVADRAGLLAELRAQDGPVVVKPVRSQGSRDTYFVPVPDALPAGLLPTPGRPFVVEEFLQGRGEGDFADYVSVEGLVEDGRVQTLGISGKLPMITPFREVGAFFPSHLPPAELDAIAGLAADAVRALGVRRGHVHSEVKLTPDGPRLIEVNGRIGGYKSELYGRVTGADWLALGIAVACGQPVGTVAPARSDTVEFQFFNNPPLEGGVLRRVDGVDAVLREPGVVDYLGRFPVGSVLKPEGGTLWMDLLRGSAPDHAGMLKTIDQCLAQMRFHIEAPDGATRVWQAGRGGLCAV